MVNDWKGGGCRDALDLNEVSCLGSVVMTAVYRFVEFLAW